MKIPTAFALLFVMLLSPWTVCRAEPFLISDPYPPKDPQPTKFLVSVNGKVTTVDPERKGDGSVVLKYDLGALPDGSHTITVKAVNEQQSLESGEIAYTFTKAGPKISGLKIKEEKQKIPPSRSLNGYVRQ